MTNKLWLLLGLFIPLMTWGQSNPSEVAPRKEFKQRLKDASTKLEEGRIYAGNTFDMPDRKNYIEAIKILKSVGNSANLDLFRVYLTGGYGIAPNSSKAKTYHEKLLTDEKISVKHYAYKTDLDLREFYDIQMKAEGGDIAMQVKLARFYLEFELSRYFADFWLKEAASKGSIDAKYLLKCTELYLKNYNQEINKIQYQEALEKVAKSYAEKGSYLAGGEYVYLRETVAHKVSAGEAERFLKPMIESKNTSEEAQLKALVLLEEAQQGSAKLGSMRRIYDYCNKHTAYQTNPVSMKYYNKFKEIDKKLATVKGLYEVTQSYGAKTIDLNLDEFDKNYNDNYDRMLKVFKQIAEPENKTFIGTKNFTNYQNEFHIKFKEILHDHRRLEDLIHLYSLLSQPSSRFFTRPKFITEYQEEVHVQLLRSVVSAEKADEVADNFRKLADEASLTAVVNQHPEAYLTAMQNKFKHMIQVQNNVRQVLRIRKMFETDEFKKSLFPDYQIYTDKKLKEFELSSQEIEYESVKVELEYHQFKSFEEGKRFWESVKNNNQIEAEKRKRLEKQVKRKTIKDIFGDTHALDVLHQLKADMAKHTWLKPESERMYKKYLFESVKYDIDHTKIITFDYGKKMYDRIMNEAELKDVSKKLVKVIRAKTVTDIYGENPSREKVSELRQELDTRTWLKPQGEEIYEKYMTKYRLEAFNNKKFTSLSDAETSVRKIKNDPNISASSKKSMMKILQEKVLSDVYGENPTLVEIEALEQVMRSSDWLDVQNNQMRFKYLNDSKYSFSGTVYTLDHSQSYLYEVKRPNEEPKYHLKVYKLQPMRQKIYETPISIEYEGNNYIVDIPYKKKINSYSWRKMVGNSFQGKYPKVGNYIIPVQKGGLFSKITTDKEHGYGENYLKKKEDEGEFTEKAAIRTALKYWIFSYRSVMDK